MRKHTPQRVVNSMLTKSLINALHKASYCVYRDGRSHGAEGRVYHVNWLDQDGVAICAQVKRISERNDSQTDYFPGFYADSIKQIVRYLAEEV